MYPKVIAFYLPQYYPFKENDEWWGAGFTEWTNVGRAKPLFKGHYQPKIPADLGYYDLRVPEVRIQQAELAREAGVYGFCYWHYWFGNGKRLLQRVFDEVIASGSPDFPLCLGWANHSWYAKTWDKYSKDKLLIEQVYGGEQDYTAHFDYALKAFRDSRYIRIDNKPVFFIYDAMAVPVEFLELWQKKAKENGLNGICFIGRIKNDDDYSEVIRKGFSFVSVERISGVIQRKSLAAKRLRQLKNIILGKTLNSYPYKEAYPFFLNQETDGQLQFIPSIIPNWDHSPRSSRRGLILTNSTPELFKKHVREVFALIENKPKENQVVFLKSWNEWGEGNYMEPDLKWGKAYIKVLREELEKFALCDGEFSKLKNAIFTT